MLKTYIKLQYFFLWAHSLISSKKYKGETPAKSPGDDARTAPRGYSVAGLSAGLPQHAGLALREKRVGR